MAAQNLKQGNITLELFFKKDNMKIANLFTWYYWSSQPYIARGFVFWLWFGLFAILAIGGVVCLVVRKNTEEKWHRPILGRFGSFGLTTGLLGLVWFFFRQERISFLGWRLWLLGWGVLFVWWLVKIIMYTVKRVPVLKKEEAERLLKQRYLPS